jgi:L-amino acid N-acyltransferase YncA/nitroimidazol reductase NimA-like FMN-containing flavoprotein (pyridoxamine 5'-phosphate oxidase superfamily)
MRRVEKEIRERSELDGVIRACTVCRLGLVDGDRPYVVPMSFGYDGRCVYLHCAQDGRKIDILRRNNHVCAVFDVMEGLVPGGDQGCRWSMRYRSVIVEGTARFVDDTEAKRHAFDVIMAQYAAGACAFPDAMVTRTCVIAVDIATISGKQTPRQPEAPERAHPGPPPSIRPARREDLDAINAIYNFYVLKSTCTYQEEPETREGRQAWFERHGAPHPVIVAEIDGRVVGWGSLSAFRTRSAYRQTVEDSIYVADTHRGQGVGTALLRELLVQARALGHHAIIADIDSEQAASIALHARCGFGEVGRLRQVGLKFGRWLDVVCMELQLSKDGPDSFGDDGPRRG